MMKKLIFVLLTVLYSNNSFALTTEGEIDMVGAMTVSTAWDNWITLKGVSTLSSCRKSPEHNLILFRIKREEGEKAILSIALTALTTKRKVRLLINPSNVDRQGNCYISAIYLY